MNSLNIYIYIYCIECLEYFQWQAWVEAENKVAVWAACGIARGRCCIVFLAWLTTEHNASGKVSKKIQKSKDAEATGNEMQRVTSPTCLNLRQQLREPWWLLRRCNRSQRSKDHRDPRAIAIREFVEVWWSIMMHLYYAFMCGFHGQSLTFFILRFQSTATLWKEPMMKLMVIFQQLLSYAQRTERHGPMVPWSWLLRFRDCSSFTARPKRARIIQENKRVTKWRLWNNVEYCKHCKVWF